MDYISLAGVFFALVFDKLNIFLFLIISAAMHELGHISACFLCGVNPRIDISVFGFKLCRYPTETAKKLFVLVCGPLVNLFLIFISLFLLSRDFSLNLYIFLCVNFIIFLFNMLPIHFLDGGQIISTFMTNSKTIKLLDTASLIIIFAAISMFSKNIVNSLAIYFIFLLYYIINKSGLH